MIEAKFEPGKIVITPGVMDTIPEHEVIEGLTRHLNCDWGDLEPEDVELNEHSLIHGNRLFSAYESKSNVKFWIITESDRSATTILLPDEY